MPGKGKGRAEPGAEGRRTAGSVLTDRIAELAARLAELEPSVRVNEPDAVHQMRVACRRLRSALQAFGDLLADDRGAIEELRWLAGELGQARDSEVLGERLRGLAGALPEEADPGRLDEAIRAWEDEQYRQAWPKVLAALDSARYRSLLATLDGLVADPPLSERAEHRAGRELARTVQREYRRTARRIAAAEAADPGEDTENALHDARKAAKRARYTGELVGAAAAKFARRMKAVQDLLGRHQDDVIGCASLRELAADAPDGLRFGYGVLYGQQLDDAARAREELPTVWRPLRKPPKLAVG